jgi:hypothetical protein
VDGAGRTDAFGSNPHSLIYPSVWG